MKKSLAETFLTYFFIMILIFVRYVIITKRWRNKKKETIFSRRITRNMKKSNNTLPRKNILYFIFLLVYKLHSS